MTRTKICPECRKTWIRQYGKRWRTFNQQRKARGIKLKTLYPDWVRHHNETRFCLRHQATRCAESSKRRAAKIKATPPWADHAAIRQIYLRAVELTKATGEKYHVDHIVPLRGKNVCGLHVPNNLQIIKAKDNIRKGNKFNSFHTGEETRQGVEIACDTGTGS